MAEAPNSTNDLFNENSENKRIDKNVNCRTKGDYIMKQRKHSSRCVSRFCGLGGG